MAKKIELTQEEQKLYNELKKLSKRANQRIVRLEREFGKDAWATRFLREKLESEPIQSWTQKGRVKANKSMSLTQMRATLKATKQFLNSVSTKTRVKKAKKKSIEKIKEKFGIDANDLTYKEAESLTNFFEDKEVNNITNFTKGSTVLDLIENAKEGNQNYVDFSDIFSRYIIYNKGKSYEKELKKIYIKYVFQGNKKQAQVRILYGNVIDLINSAENDYDLEELENMIESIKSDGRLNNRDYNYLINLIEEKRSEL